MIYFYFTLILLFMGSISMAQEKDSIIQQERERREKNIQAGNPFKKYGYTPKIATLSDGKYLEFHDLDSIVIIGSVYYNRITKKVVDFVERDMTNPDAQPLSDIRGRWLSPDPLSEEFSDWSPYTFVYNNPLRFNDPTGMAPEDIYKLNANGTLTWVSESNTDVVYAAKDFNSDNSVKDGAKGVEVGEKGYIANNTASQSYALGDETIINTVISFGGNGEKAKEVFKFFADNSDVEFNVLAMSNNGDNVSSFVSTLNSSNSTLAMLQSGFNIMEENIHSHPAGATYDVSGYNSKWYEKHVELTPSGVGGDRRVTLTYPNASHGLYIPATNSQGLIPKSPTNIFIRYNKDGAISTQTNVSKIP